jgi:hypothetical protein
VKVGLGVGLIAAGSLLGLLVVFAAWGRVAAAASLAALVGCGALVGAGALLVQDAASGVEWALTLVALSVLTPVHARLVFGPPGPRDGRRMVAEGPGAA